MKMLIPEPIKRFSEIFSKLPSIGPRQALRLAFHLVNAGKNEINSLEEAANGLKSIKTCGQCFFIHQTNHNFCPICADGNRNKKIIAVVEKETDLVSLEKTKRFHGNYLVLGGLVKDGLLSSNQKLRLKNLTARIQNDLAGQADEIILAVNPTTFGDFTAALIMEEVKPFAKKISRLGRGIPTGGEIEFADEETLSQALERRM